MAERPALRPAAILGLHIISTRANHRYSFPKEVRLLRPPEFRRVYDTGRRTNLDFLLAFVLPNGSAVSRIGVTVPRSVGGSVERNRVKRRLREAVRKQLELLGPGWDVVFNARAAAKDRPYLAFEATVKRCFESLHRTATARSASV